MIEAFFENFSLFVRAPNGALKLRELIISLEAVMDL